MREHFHVPANYFLSHSVGCLPKRTAGRLSETYFQPWQSEGGNAWPGWMEGLDRFRVGMGDLLGAEARQICPQTNVSSALTKIIHALPDTGKRKTILCTEQDFPTIGFVLKQAERAGFNLRFVTGDVTEVESWTDVWDESVAVAHMTHAFSNTSKLAPVAELCALARARGTISIVDIAQSAGAVPIDLLAWNPDFAIGTGVKFLCFGPGACYLYASDAMIETCNPIDVGWFSHEAPFEMDIHDFRYATSAMRFFGGTPSPAPFMMANFALSLWAEIGLETVHARIQRHLSRLTAAIPEEMLVSPTNAATRGGTLVLAPNNSDRFREVLAAENILFDERSEGFRFSIHGYTNGAEVDLLKEAVTS